jgi:hypothetical protein
MSDGPINYMPGLAPTNPLQAFGQGYGMLNQITSGFTERQNAQNQALAQAQAAQAQAQAAAEQKKRQQELTAKVFGGNGTAEDRANLLFMMAPEQAKVAQTAFDNMDKDTRTQKALDAGKIVAAYQSGNSEIGQQLMEERIAAQRASGDEAGAQLNEKMLAAEKIHLGQIANYLKNTMALFPEGRDMLDSQLKVEAAPHDLNLTDANAAKAWADAFKTRMEADKGTPLSAEADKIINSATDTVNGSLLLASQAQNLADAWDKLKPPGGWVGTMGEMGKKAGGLQDKVTSLRQEYVKLRNTDVLKNLPPGVASDKDIEIALAAFPSDNSNPEQVSSFLKGMAKLQKYNAEVNKAKAEWVAQNGNLGPARSPFSVGDKGVTKGTSFWDFTKAIPIPNVAGGASDGGNGAPSGKFGAGGTPSGAPAPAAGAKVITGAF